MQTTEVRVLTLTWVWHARQKLVLERWTNPKLPRRTCSCEYGLQSCRGKSAGSAKRPRERSPTRNPLRFATLFIAVSPVVLTRALPCRKTPTRAKGARGVLFDQRLLVQHPHAHGRNAMGRGGFSGGAEDLPQATGASGGHLRENSVWGGGLSLGGKQSTPVRKGYGQEPPATCITEVPINLVSPPCHPPSPEGAGRCRALAPAEGASEGDALGACEGGAGGAPAGPARSPASP
jgi:hypothetical protein